MKFRFSAAHKPQGFRQKKQIEVTHFAFNTEEVAAWTLYPLDDPLDDDLSGLDLWFKGVAEPISISEKIVGTPTFQSVLTLLFSEFPDIDSLKLRTNPDR